ncbi:MAG: HD domain-containing phosphohydrolase [Polyangiaceae bacterium]
MTGPTIDFVPTAGHAGKMARLARALREDGRLAGHPVVQPHPLLVTLRHDDRVVVLAPASAWAEHETVLMPFIDDFSRYSAALIVLGQLSSGSLQQALDRGLFATLSRQPGRDELFVAIQNAFELLSARRRSETRGEWLNRYRYEIGEFAEIAEAITTERELDKLLALILEKSRFVTGADAGSIYVVEGEDPDIAHRRLHFKLSQNDSISFDAGEFTVPINPSSMAGYVALNNVALNIPEVYELPADSPFHFDRSFDETTSYRTRSMLCTPLSSRHGEVVGVIQLLNKKRDPHAKIIGDGADLVVSFDQHSESLLAMLASLAGVALENAILYEENQQMLAGFVRASVEAIEQRDPTTSGHSIRVATMTTTLAKALERNDTGRYSEVRWTRDDLKELEYASLLHDFGKLGVSEQVLIKAKKLYPHELQAVRARFSMALRAMEVDTLKRQLDATRRGAKADEVAAFDVELENRRTQLEDAFDIIVAANEPEIVKGNRLSTLDEIARLTFVDHRGEQQTLLTDAEVESLTIPRGSLTSSEMQEIRGHVVHTYEFLKQIPWGRKFRRLPEIASAHHERLDGTGYPNRLRATEIPLQSKLMSVCDIFDALTAADRPYKRAVPVDRALSILDSEVEGGHIDDELVRIFVDARCWTHVNKPFASTD